VNIIVMAASNNTLDEISYARPDIIQWWVSEGGQPMDENMIHRYLCESPFFDWSTKNGLFMQQAAVNFDMHMLSRNRKAFEDALRSAKGVEYMIVGDPQLVADKTQAAQGVKTGIWTIRKQDRQTASSDRYLRPPGVILDGEWELTVLGTYFIVGENVFQAPSVADVVSNRLLAATASMNQFFESASGLPRYSPSRGYTYLPVPARQTVSNSLSETSPSQSREGSVAPNTDAISVRSSSIQPDSQPDATAPTAEFQDSRLLENSLWMAFQYGDEYMDENPLIGEPDQFKFAATTTAISKKRAEQEEAEAKLRAKRNAISTSQGSPSKVEKSSSPPAVFSESKASSKGEKGTKEERRISKMGEKIKRRKSRPGASGLGPATPIGPGTPTAASSIA
jgi:mediator of RNA polymerase II transcription subunit 6